MLPGLISGSFFFIDTSDERQPKVHKVVEGKDITEKTGLVTY